MPQTKIRKRQIQLEGDDGLHSEYLRRTTDDSTNYALSVAGGKPAGDPGLDLTGHRIINVAEAVLDTDAPNWGQVRNLVIQGEYRGEIVGYVVVRGSTTKYVQDADGDGNNEETDAPAITGGLYLYLSGSVTTAKAPLTPRRMLLTLEVRWLARCTFSLLPHSRETSSRIILLTRASGPRMFT
jgi:hypothetical protein